MRVIRGSVSEGPRAESCPPEKTGHRVPQRPQPVSQRTEPQRSQPLRHSTCRGQSHRPRGRSVPVPVPRAPRRDVLPSRGRSDGDQGCRGSGARAPAGLAVLLTRTPASWRPACPRPLTSPSPGEKVACPSSPVPAGRHEGSQTLAPSQGPSAPARFLEVDREEAKGASPRGGRLDLTVPPARALGDAGKQDEVFSHPPAGGLATPARGPQLLAAALHAERAQNREAGRGPGPRGRHGPPLRRTPALLPRGLQAAGSPSTLKPAARACPGPPGTLQRQHSPGPSAPARPPAPSASPSLRVPSWAVPPSHPPPPPSPPPPSDFHLLLPPERALLSRPLSPGDCPNIDTW